MSTTYLIAPHDDDHILFAAFTCLREKPQVVIVYDSYVQRDRGISFCSAEDRAGESFEACKALGLLRPPIRLGFRDDQPADPEKIFKRFCAMANCDPCKLPLVYSPAAEAGGHEQHNLVASAFDIYGKVAKHYLTYTREPCQKSTQGPEVPILDHRWIAMKLRALACFESQFQAATGCAEHFIGRSLREYYL